MHPDDEPQTTLSKWPFIIGDVLLVATALAIAILGNWQLTDWQVGACVAAVALGAALFILPYIVEFQVRVREEREDRAADMRILEKHLLSAEQGIDAADARIRALESAAAEADDPNAALAEVMDQKIAQQEAARAAQEEVIQALQKNLQELAAKELPAAFDPEVLKPIEKRLKALEASPAPKPAPVEAPLPSKPEPENPEPKTPVSNPEQNTPDPVKPEQVAPPEPEKKVAPIERPQREARERHGPEESRLLKRAISEKGDKSSTAVSRIIESKMKEKAAEAPKETESPEPETGKEEPAVQEKEAPKVEKPEPVEKEASKKVEPKAEESKSEPKEEEPEVQPQAEVDDKDSDSDEDLKPEPALAKPAQEPEPEPKAEEKPESQNDAIDLDAEVPAMDSSDMLFDDAAVSSPVKKTKAKKNDAVLTASVFIGIGNKPYLRGSGGGLSWEKGQLMEFQEIGKWRWVAPSDLEGPLELQIYRNDEDPDKSGKFTLEAGQKLEVTPVF